MVSWTRGCPPRVVVAVCAAVAEKVRWEQMRSEKTAAFNSSPAPHAKKTSPPRPNLRNFQSEQLHPAARLTHSHFAGNCWRINTSRNSTSDTSKRLRRWGYEIRKRGKLFLLKSL